MRKVKPYGEKAMRRLLGRRFFGERSQRFFPHGPEVVERRLIEVGRQEGLGREQLVAGSVEAGGGGRDRRIAYAIIGQAALVNPRAQTHRPKSKKRKTGDDFMAASDER